MLRPPLPREHAVVLGAGMTGLVAARVLSECYRTVTVIERDRLPDGPAQRRGVPQGRHLHVLLSHASRILEDLFPGFLGELVAAGANVLDGGDLSRIDVRFGPYRFNRSEQVSDPAALVTYLASRPFLEFHLRRRAAALGNVRLLDGHDVVAPIAAVAGRVSGVRVVNRETGEESALDADLTVDAMGRAARTPAFLEQLGYQRPAEQRGVGHCTYFSQLLHIPDGMFDEKMVMFRPWNGLPIGGLLAYEDGTWMLTAGEFGADQKPPTDLAGMLALVAHPMPPAVLSALQRADSLGEVAVYRVPPGVWRRYDRMPRFPAGLLVMGDALCTFNPIYGQGITMAALEALMLRDQLRNETVHLPHRFFRAAARRIEPVWAMNQATDRALSGVPEQRSASSQLRGWMTDQALKAAEHDIVLTERFVRVSNLVDPPTRLQDPALLARALVGNLRRFLTASC